MRKSLLIVALLLAACSFVACSSERQAKRPDNVIIIGADGFAAFMIRENLGAFPNIEKLMARGSSTLEMRSVLPSSSAVNWASIFMGAGPELHGYTEWGSRTPDLPSRELSSRGMFPGIFGLVRDKYPDAETGAFYPWDGIGYLLDTTAISVNSFVAGDSVMTREAVNYLVSKKPKFAFFYFAESDGTGHKMGWESPEYLDMCKKIDAYVGDILAGIEKSGMKDNTAVIFISDHGGIGNGHGGKTMREMQVPYIIAGPGIKQNHKIEESVMVFDNAAIIAYLFDIETPQVWLGRAPLSIFK